MDRNWCNIPSDRVLLWWERNSSSLQLTTWKDFKIIIKNTFQPLFTEQAARDKLYDMSQTTTIAAYIKDFKILLAEIGITETEAEHKFIRGLKPLAKQHVLLTNPPSLEKHIKVLLSMLLLQKIKVNLFNSIIIKPNSLHQPTSLMIPWTYLYYNDKINFCSIYFNDNKKSKDVLNVKSLGTLLVNCRSSNNSNNNSNNRNYNPRFNNNGSSNINRQGYDNLMQWTIILILYSIMIVIIMVIITLISYHFSFSSPLIDNNKNLIDLEPILGNQESSS